jgi:hypothetical protein
MMNANEAQRYARVAGVLIAISLLAGGFGESFVPGKLIAAGDFHETSLRVAASLGLFRAGFVAYLIEAACDLFLTAIFYLMLRPVSRPLSLITAFLGVFCTATFAVGEIFYYVAALRCAGINRHEAGNERVLRERSSEPLGPEFCVAHREVFGEA